MLKQNAFYADGVRKNRLLNNVLYIRNLIILRLGSFETPANPIKQFWIFHTVMLFVVFLLCLFNAFKILLVVALLCFIISAKYETIYFNYQDSLEFTHNFNLNSRYWIVKLANNDHRMVGGVFKRLYSGTMRESIKYIYDKSALIWTNLNKRTIVTIGGFFFAVGTLSVGGCIAGNYIHEQGLNTRHNMTVEAEDKKHKREKAMEQFIQTQETERNRMKYRRFYEK